MRITMLKKFVPLLAIIPLCSTTILADTSSVQAGQQSQRPTIATVKSMSNGLMVTSLVMWIW